MKYEVNVRFKGSDGWQKICDCETMEQALDEVRYQHTLEDDRDCEYLISESHD